MIRQVSILLATGVWSGVIDYLRSTLIISFFLYVFFSFRVLNRFTCQNFIKTQEKVNLSVMLKKTPGHCMKRSVKVPTVLIMGHVWDGANLLHPHIRLVLTISESLH